SHPTPDRARRSAPLPSHGNRPRLRRVRRTHLRGPDAVKTPGGEPWGQILFLAVDARSQFWPQGWFDLPASMQATRSDSNVPTDLTLGQGCKKQDLTP